VAPARGGGDWRLPRASAREQQRSCSVPLRRGWARLDLLEQIDAAKLEGILKAVHAAESAQGPVEITIASECGTRVVFAYYETREAAKVVPENLHGLALERDALLSYAHVPQPDAVLLPIDFEEQLREHLAETDGNGESCCFAFRRKETKVWSTCLVVDQIRQECSCELRSQA
jgi:hypothetical protein